METKEIRVSKATSNLMQAIGRLQDAYFEMCEALESGNIGTDEFVKPWNTINDVLRAKIGVWVMEIFGNTDKKEI